MNALVTTNVQLPAHLANRVGGPSALAGAMTAGIGTPSTYKKISIRGGRFRIREGSNESVLPSLTLRAVIVGASPNMTKLFYKGKYDPNAEDKSPDCYSNDGVRPAKDANDPQAQLCATCPQNEWGSKMSDAGNKMKACADQKRLAIISADDHSDEPEVYLFQVTPAALSDFRKYGDLLASKGFPPELVVTELSFDTDASFPKVQFKFGGFVEESMVPVIDKVVGSDIVKEIIGDTPQTAQVVEAPISQAKPAPVKQPVVEEVEVEVMPAPTKGFGSPAPAPKPAEPPATLKATAVKSSGLTNDIQSILASIGDDDE